MGAPDRGLILPRRVVVVGGGAAGTLAAIHLAAHDGLEPIVVERSERLGEGVAYGTMSPSHLLNVRADGMSAFPDRATHFTEWARNTGHSLTGAEFLPRMLYARYLREVLEDAATTRGPMAHVRARAVRLVGEEPRVVLADGTHVVGDDVVLATGNGLAPLPWLPDAPGVVRDPWSPGALEALQRDASVVIVGSGLTAVDVLLSLRGRDHQGPVTMVSSHGLLPEAHLPGPLAARPPAIDPASVAGARGLLRSLRADAAAADDWRQVIDGVRPVSVAAWRALSLDERRRALRHLARRWEVRRHRMAPAVAAEVARARASGGLSVVPGRVRAVEGVGGRLVVRLASEGSLRMVPADAVIACVGPSADPLHDPFLATALRDGVLARHPLGLGLDVDAAGRARRPDGTVHEHLWTMGSLRKGADWECTAVPELRRHAHDIAGAIARTA